MPRQPATKTSAVREPLAFALSSKGKVAALRVLALIEEPITQRELARRARLQHRTIQLALEELVALGLVARVEGGRDFNVKLNHTHHLAPSLLRLFREEALHFNLLRRELRNAVLGDFLEGRPHAVIAFGSAARAEDTPSSDLDVLVIAANAEAVREALERLEGASGEIEQTFGVRIRPIVYSLRQARALWKARRPPLQEAYRDGLQVLGPPIPELLG